MNQFDLQRFWRKYGNLILGGLFFLFIISYCNQQTRYTAQKAIDQPNKSIRKLSEHDSSQLKSFEELMSERQSQKPERPGSLFTMLLLLMLGVGIVWMIRQSWWKSFWMKWFPGRVSLRVAKGKDHVTGRKLLKISIVNKTQDGLTFMPPMVVFSKWGKERRFRLKGSDQDDMFPLTLTPGTGHGIVIDLDQFYEKIPDLKGANRVGALVETSGEKEYKSFALPRWLDWLVK
jgi:hypothetical protein